VNEALEDIHPPEILASVGHFDYITGVLKRPRDASAPARYYSSIEDWETTDAYYVANMQRQLADMFRDRQAAEKKVGELIERNQAQERTIGKLLRQLLEAQARIPGAEGADAVVSDAERLGWPAGDVTITKTGNLTVTTVGAAPEQIAAAGSGDPPLPTLPRHAKIPCRVDGCESLMAIGTPMAAHRMRKHKVWHNAQMELGRSVEERGAALEAIAAAAQDPTEPEALAEPDEPLAPPLPLPPTPVAPPQRPPPPPIPDAPATPDAVRENQRLQLEKQFSSLSAPFFCQVCQRNLHAQSVTDPTRCQRCVLEGRYADDAVVAVST